MTRSLYAQFLIFKLSFWKNQIKDSSFSFNALPLIFSKEKWKKFYLQQCVPWVSWWEVIKAFFNWLKMVSHNTMKISQNVLKWKNFFCDIGNSHLEGWSRGCRRFEWLILALSGPPSWFPHQFSSASKKQATEVQRGEKYGTICYFGHRWFQLREGTLKCFKETAFEIQQ